MAKGKSGGKRATAGQVATKAIHVDNMNEAQLNAEIAKSDRKLQRLEKTMRANLDSGGSDIGLIPLNQLNGYNDKTKNSGGARAKADKQIQSTVNKAAAYTKAKTEYDYEKRRNDALNKALNTVKGTGKTTKQLKDEKLAKAGKNSAMNWTKSTQKGQFGNVTVRKSGDFEIRTMDGTSFIYKNGNRIGMTKKVKDATAFVELYNKRKK